MITVNEIISKQIDFQIMKCVKNKIKETNSTNTIQLKISDILNSFKILNDEEKLFFFKMCNDILNPITVNQILIINNEYTYAMEYLFISILNSIELYKTKNQNNNTMNINFRVNGLYEIVVTNESVFDKIKKDIIESCNKTHVNTAVNVINKVGDLIKDNERNPESNYVKKNKENKKKIKDMINKYQKEVIDSQIKSDDNILYLYMYGFLILSSLFFIPLITGPILLIYGISLLSSKISNTTKPFKVTSFPTISNDIKYTEEFNKQIIICCDGDLNKFYETSVIRNIKTMDFKGDDSNLVEDYGEADIYDVFKNKITLYSAPDPKSICNNIKRFANNESYGTFDKDKLNPVYECGVIPRNKNNDGTAQYTLNGDDEKTYYYTKSLSFLQKLQTPTTVWAHSLGYCSKCIRLYYYNPNNKTLTLRDKLTREPRVIIFKYKKSIPIEIPTVSVTNENIENDENDENKKNVIASEFIFIGLVLLLLERKNNLNFNS